MLQPEASHYDSDFPPTELRTKIKKTLSDDKNESNKDGPIVEFRVPKIEPEWETDEEVLDRLKSVFR